MPFERVPLRSGGLQTTVGELILSVMRTFRMCSYTALSSRLILRGRAHACVRACTRIAQRSWRARASRGPAARRHKRATLLLPWQRGAYSVRSDWKRAACQHSRRAHLHTTRAHQKAAKFWQAVRQLPNLTWTHSAYSKPEGHRDWKASQHRCLGSAAAAASGGVERRGGGCRRGTRRGGGRDCRGGGREAARGSWQAAGPFLCCARR